MRGRTWIEVDAAALRANLRRFQRLVGKSVQIAPVLKANAYGHGTRAVVRSLAQRPFWAFCVASGDEALALRALTGRRIIAVSNWETTDLPALIAQNVELVAWDLPSAQTIDRAARRIGRRAAVHVKFDTGAARIGLRPERAADFWRALPGLAHLRLAGAFSHFADSEYRHRGFTRHQLDVFETATRAAPPTALLHIACTAAAVRYPESHHALVRLGIGLYGLWPSPQTRLAARRRWPTLTLTPALRWQTRLQQLKAVPRDTPIGYGLTHRTTRPTRLGVLPVGYWDGLDRGLSNRGAVLIRGQRAPILGRVCMNLTMIDCTDVRSAQRGDLITLIGGQGRGTVSVDDHAVWADTINYEILARLAEHIPRFVV